MYICHWSPACHTVTTCPNSSTPTPKPDSETLPTAHHSDPPCCGDPVPLCLTCLGESAHHSSEGEDVNSEGVVHLEGVHETEGVPVCHSCDACFTDHRTYPKCKKKKTMLMTNNDRKCNSCYMVKGACECKYPNIPFSGPQAPACAKPRPNTEKPKKAKMCHCYECVGSRVMDDMKKGDSPSQDPDDPEASPMCLAHISPHS